ncbi:MAG: hypothetical protein ABIG44_14920 [Planctomycetota bacterium]
MNKVWQMILVAMWAAVASAAPLTLQLTPDGSNPMQPAMGDIMQFRSLITASDQPVEGLVAWISLVEIDPGHEQPMDLEDWSAHKAVSEARLDSGVVLKTDWSMRLIQSGEYRVVVSATARGQDSVFTSPTVTFQVASKPVVESRRILPVAIGVPILLLGMLGNRRRQRLSP